MSAICATVNFNSHSMDFERLRRMGRSMILRGGDMGRAYINGGVGLLQFGTDLTLPYTLSLGVGRYTAVIDGSPSFSADESEQHVADSLLRRYADIGYEAICELSGDFSLVIFDEYEGKLILARDSLGARPLYYYRTDGGAALASEIKGLLPLFERGARISLDAYRGLLVAPSGMIDGTDLYRDILELEPSSIAVISKNDISIYKYTSLYSDSEKRVGEKNRLEYGHDPMTLTSLLCEALVAFDHPQFDLYMPPLLSLLRNAQGQRTVQYEEPFMDIDEKYALQRADRLGMLYRVRAIPTKPSSPCPVPQRAARATEKALSELFCALREDHPERYATVLSLAGPTALDILKKDRNAARRARLYALLLQTDLWVENYRLTFD